MHNCSINNIYKRTKETISVKKIEHLDDYKKRNGTQEMPNVFVHHSQHFKT